MDININIIHVHVHVLHCVPFTAACMYMCIYTCMSACLYGMMCVLPPPPVVTAKEHEGLYRLPGVKSKIEEVKSHYDRGGCVQLGEPKYGWLLLNICDQNRGIIIIMLMKAYAQVRDTPCIIIWILIESLPIRTATVHVYRSMAFGGADIVPPPPQVRRWTYLRTTPTWWPACSSSTSENCPSPSSLTSWWQSLTLLQVCVCVCVCMSITLDRNYIIINVGNVLYN